MTVGSEVPDGWRENKRRFDGEGTQDPVHRQYNSSEKNWAKYLKGQMAMNIKGSNCPWPVVATTVIYLTLTLGLRAQVEITTTTTAVKASVVTRAARQKVCAARAKGWVGGAGKHRPREGTQRSVPSDRAKFPPHLFGNEESRGAVREGSPKDGVERIWRREGLKVPQKQKPRGRLWLNDGSCVRLRPTHRNHVWSYDFGAP